MDDGAKLRMGQHGRRGTYVLEPQPAAEALTERAEPVDDSGARETPGGSPPGPPTDDPATAALTTSPANEELPDSPKDAADVLKKVGQIATFIGSWHAAADRRPDAAAGTGANASALAAAIEDANGLAGHERPEAAVRWIMTDSDKVITLVGPQSWLMANALSAADRAWPHPRGDWHTGISEWPAAPVEVVNTADRVCAALDEGGPTRCRPAADGPCSAVADRPAHRRRGRGQRVGASRLLRGADHHLDRARPTS